MSGINASSYVVDVWNANAPTIDNVEIDDIEAWDKIHMGANLQAEWNQFGMQAYSRAGLFSFDLSGFLADCAISTYCNNETYSAYDGSAIGQLWYIDSAESLKASGSTWITQDASIFTCFAGTKGCTGLKMVYEDSSDYGHLLMTAAYSGSLSVGSPASCADLDNAKSIYGRVMDGQYQGYGFSSDYWFSNAFREYGNTFDAWPHRSLSFWRFTAADN